MKKLFTLIVATVIALPLFSQQFKFAYLSDTHIAEGAASIEDLQACIDDINRNDDCHNYRRYYGVRRRPGE